MAEFTAKKHLDDNDPTEPKRGSAGAVQVVWEAPQVGYPAKPTAHSSQAVPLKGLGQVPHVSVLKLLRQMQMHRVFSTLR